MSHSNESKISNVSDTGTFKPDGPKPFVLRVVNPDLEEPALNRKVSKTLLETSTIEFLPPLEFSTPLFSFPSPPKPPIPRPSRYSIASSSISQPETLKLYRSMALKTQDRSVQLSFGQYLLEVAQLYARHETADRQRRLEEEGVRWIRRLASEGVGVACCMLGLWYSQGRYGFSRNLSKALKYFEVAAQQKVPQAMFEVAQFHERQQDYMTAFQLYEEAGNLGWLQAIYRIAMINLNGEFGSRCNIPAAIELLTKASENTLDSCPEAPYTLGLLLLNDYPNKNVPSELIEFYGGKTRGIEYLEESAEMGYELAQYQLGCIYEYGLYDIRVNITKAQSYYETAANTKQHGYSMLGLSRIYNGGIKLPIELSEPQRLNFEKDESNWIKNHIRDEDVAFKWCQLAANQNIPEACYLLGWYYEVGIGIPRDFEQAIKFYTIAIKKGNHKEAKERITLLETLVKHQKTEKKYSLHESLIQSTTIIKKNNTRNSQCNIM